MKIEDLEKYSERALIRAYLCAHSEGQSGCPAGGGEHCKMMKGCRKVTPNETYHHRIERYYGGKEVPEHIAYVFLPNAFGNLHDAAYIVAACNAVPMLLEMLRIAVSLIEAQNAQRARKGERIPEGDVMQLIFTLTEPKE